jgi:hypothetical protein
MILKLESMTTTVISSLDLAKEVLQKHDQIFSGRTILDDTQPPQILNGVAARNGSLGKPQESFCHANFFSTKAQFHTSR